MTDKIMVYGSQNCPNCDVAKTLLYNKNIDYHYVDITNDDEARAKLRAAGLRTIPAFFLDDIHMGGLKELQAYCRTSRIKES